MGAAIGTMNPSVVDRISYRQSRLCCSKVSIHPKIYLMKLLKYSVTTLNSELSQIIHVR
jgi:hypothetical protein